MESTDRLDVLRSSSAFADFCEQLFPSKLLQRAVHPIPLAVHCDFPCVWMDAQSHSDSIWNILYYLRFDTSSH